MKETTVEALKKENAIDLIAKQWMLVTAGTRESYNTMTANWGGVGYIWHRNVAFVFVRPERYTHDFMEREDIFTLSFYPEEYREALSICGTKSGRDIDKAAATGLVPEELPSGAMTFSQARLTLQCRKLFKSEMKDADFIERSIVDRWYGENGGFHTVYVAEIEKVYVNGDD
ncbi:MAG: flavin reductase [Bacteroidales bacterium]|nr:flavin reductase [Bacteroidales bacterium]